MRVTTIPVELPNRRGRVLRGMLYAPLRPSASRKPLTAVLMAHGFPSDSSGGTARRCLALARKGFLTMRFDFTGCGASDGAHEERLISTDLADIRVAVDFLHAHAAFDRFVLHGHSTGAIDAALYARTDKRIDALILSGGVSKLDEAVRYDFTDRQVRDFWTRGYTYTTHPLAWLPLGGASKGRGKIIKRYYDEFFLFDIPKAIKQFHRPVLIIHGEDDEAIPSKKDPLELYALANRPKKLVVIPDGDHRFSKTPKIRSAYLAALERFLRTI